MVSPARRVSRLCRSPNLALAAFVAASHAFGGLLFLARRGEFGLPLGWSAQFLALLAVSLGLSLAAVLSPRGSVRAVSSLVLAFLCYLLLGFPLPVSSGIQLVLGLPLMIESAALLRKPASFLAGLGIVASTVLVKRADLAWGRPVEQAAPEQLALFAFVLLLVFAVSLSLWELEASRRRALGEIERLDRAIGRLSDINAAFQDALVSADEDFSLLERNRITREIHDIIGYALTNQQMMLEAAFLLTDEKEERLRELLGMARATVADGLRDARRALYELRQGEAAHEDLGFGVLVKVARNFQSVTGVQVTVDFTNARGEIPRGAWLTLYRLVQESMINSFRHGDAKNIAITLREDKEALYVNVRDDGRGAANVIEGIGLKGMRERAEALGGELRAGNASDGFLVSARLPKDQGRREERESD